MEEIFLQSFETTAICLYKNYWSLDNAPRSFPRTIDVENDDVFGVAKSSAPWNTVMALGHSHNHTQLYLYEKDTKHYFYFSPNSDYEIGRNPRSPNKDLKYVPIILESVGNKVFYTQKERQIKRHYGNPFSQISIQKFERWIKKDGDKIIIKLFVKAKTRNFNCRYFTKTIDSTTITFDTKGGNFNCIKYSTVRKSKIRSFYRNSFLSLQNALDVIFSLSGKFNGNDEQRELFKSKFSNSDFYQELRKALSLKYDDEMLTQLAASKLLSSSSQTEVAKSVYIQNFIREWKLRFIDLKKIKMPNDEANILTKYYPTERYLKKNDRKLVAAVLDKFNIKSKITIKLMHTVPHINMLDLVRLCYLFGKNFSKYIGNIDILAFTAQSKDKSDSMYERYTVNNFVNGDKPDIDITESEKEKIIKILNNVYDVNRERSDAAPLRNNNLIDSLFDHFRMLSIARVYYPDIRLRAQTYETYQQEHIELSRIERQINKGYVIDIEYDENMVKEIEKEIIILRQQKQTQEDFDAGIPCIPEKDVYIPSILKSSFEYSEEGSYMHHCVSGYAEKNNSIIVSLRYGLERVTSEFDIRTRKCIQSRYFCNDPYPEHFKKPIEILCQRIKTVPFLNPGNRVKVPLKINGVVITTVNPEAAELLPRVNDMDRDINDIINDLLAPAPLPFE